MKRFSARAHTLQTIDRFIGVPVCGLLTLVRRLGRGFGRERRDPPSVRQILFVKLAEQGSTVLAYDAIRTAVARVGPEHVYFLVFEENRFVLDALGLIPPENVFVVRTRSPWSMATSCLARLREIRRRRIDTCVDMEFFARSSAAIAFLSGARRRVGFHTYFAEGPYRGDLLTHRVLYNPHLHTSSTFITLVLAMDVDPRALPALPVLPPSGGLPPPFRFRDHELAEVRAILVNAGVAPGSPLILLNANASDLLPLRRWAGDNYVALAQRLLAEFPSVTVAFTGSPEEAPAIAALVRAVDSPRCVCLAGRTTLRQLLVLYGLAEVLVTNDSGPAHFAALTSIDVVALFGPETPLLFAAPGPRNHAVWAGIPCSPCVNAYNNRQTACRNNVCMQMITIDQVFELVGRIVRERAARTVG